MKHKKLVFVLLVIGIMVLLFYTNISDDIPSDTSSHHQAHAVSSDDAVGIDIDIDIDTQNMELQLIRMSGCNNISSNGRHCVCDYVNLKGLPKSGTSWMIASLSRIQQYFCEQRGANKLSLEICIKWHVGSYHRHPLVLPQHNDNPRLMKHFGNKRSAFLEELKTKRFCSITAFRDPRDRKVSWSHWTLKQNKSSMQNDSLLFEAVNAKTMNGYQSAMRNYNEYWKAFRGSELKQPMLFYNYFYDDMVLDTFHGIQRMIEFIGFHHVRGLLVTEEDIEHILQRMGSGALIAEGANILFRKGKICGFH